ncbi:MAG: TatD family hydrolase [Pseudomonadota bacterium]|nr:TatD family hydrolase [Pseudomonadota bacterium]
MPYIDTHTHLDFAAFDPDRDQVLSDCARLGVERLVVLGVTRSNWQAVWRLCRQHTNLYAAFGLHPMFMAEHAAEHVAALQQCLAERLEDARCCAVGEFGLDYWDKNADRAAQQQLFEAQLQLAVEYQLPSLLHVRKAHADVIATLKRYRPARGGIIHAFSGSPEEAREYHKLGFKLGLGGAATWPQATRLRQTIAQLPGEQLVLETDSPDMAPSFHAHQRNSPALLPQIAAQLAALRGESAAEFSARCWQNSCELFQWSA